MQSIVEIIASEINAKAAQVSAAVALLDEGATVPFIARYRKEVTGGLDDTQLRTLDVRLDYLRELNERKATILESIRSQEKLTPVLEQKIQNTLTKTELEDLYLPYKPKRRTKAQIAREAGIEPMAMALLASPTLDPSTLVDQYLNPEAGFADEKSVLDGARFILIEHMAEQADLVGKLRQFVWDEGVIVASVDEAKKQAAIKYSDYFEFREPIKTIPSHRALALLRGKKEELLNVELILPEPAIDVPQSLIADYFGLTGMHKWMSDTVRLCWRSKLFLSLALEHLGKMRDEADDEAIKVFAKNLKDLLLMAPAGNQAILGIDPGQRTGCKIACVDATGKVLDTTVIYPHAPQNQWAQSLAVLEALCHKHQLTLVSIGNGTASRESDKLAAELCERVPNLKKIVVSEAGASVYSASELAAKEFPDMDVALRGAVSIARRLQDPLAELVKIDPKSIGVGQYQHDVNQTQLNKSLTAVVEDCVNAVGVDVNTASTALLTYISGLNGTIAQNIVNYRDENGAFENRKALKKVPRLGDKTFEQAAGFLRIFGDNPLDRSAVHPEAYPVVERILAKHAMTIDQVIGNVSFLKGLKAADYTCEKFGVPTVMDIIKELEKPGRDPRPEFKTATFKEGIETLKDLKEGMLLEGVITNVANFGAFVDIGVHQDGLVHISALADRFVKDPHEVVKVGDIVKVKVIEVDVPRNRIQLTMRLTDDVNQMKNPSIKGPPNKGSFNKKVVKEAPSNNPFAAALQGLKK
ncbi:RNA-binding transcriptional accessory protein [Wohlfahrtiimonas chitiniclastica]|uniref:Tex family protein n=1 Tax=Wohlfahrtiimonas chitiniclastica TaxID=400946 RepID=UPI000B984AD6|nr:Tex family protein [Wohlfahrtiimonas chitiniclastica]OYQ71247.1 RNA-binding transcriptional accessory protein [Wohlfahrtiimonas chitiniclastica]OYQ82903.1 RNA-binding transcriptional accessory protein [Wohlfahrtiimonas chitiniclastica]OYQ85064.1 RNA-binding transcriptional accessory protein [Wohlfahrtiimonas chitiniclastica]OYQ86702.1 RNA-binding transcriptional accessory protein [Wohlfahrtiimonas chitiniclastica]